ncbi:EIN2 targeting protein1 [Corchorus olitorius]|uniref:EIN2 targeting protein1 n=1 Tax=Corchorus olitorius TaxID=93759 RepID=A0A1R3KEE0_9ROSI|nr:EIN2 targeting protein1 [Corchorus olitorius]
MDSTDTTSPNSGVSITKFPFSPHRAFKSSFCLSLPFPFTCVLGDAYVANRGAIPTSQGQP